MSNQVDTVGYFRLLRQNADFRNLWLGQIVSSMGDWLSAAALYSLIDQVTHSGRAVALVLVFQFLPYFIMSPFAGIVADRFPRKAIMIVADLARMVTVLGLLFVRDPGTVWIAYAVVFLTESLSAFFEPARQAVIPKICKPEELFSANALTSLTWSFALMTGAGVGGLLTYFVGRTATFQLDALSFLVSASFIWRIRANTKADRTAEESDGKGGLGFREIAEGLRFIWGNKPVLAYLSVKTASGLAGGIWVLVTMFGERVFPIGAAGTAVGVLYSARGLGTAIGPFVARRIWGTDARGLRTGIGWAFVVYGVGYVALGGAPSLVIAMLMLVLAHLGGSVQWVNSTMLLQTTVPDRFRGRVFSIEWASFTLAAAMSNLLTGWLIDVFHLSARQVSVGIGVYLILPGIAWFALQSWTAARLDGSPDRS